jgi:hypothetical protein
VIDLITEGTITGKVIIGIKVVMTMVTGAIIEMVDIRDGMEAIKEIGVEIGTKIAAIITRIEIKEIRTTIIKSLLFFESDLIVLAFLKHSILWMNEYK